MNSQTQHIYVMKQELNKEYDLHRKFLVDNGFEKELRIDALIMIDGEQEEGEEEWKGLSQTMKRINGKQFDEQNLFVAREIASTNQAISTVAQAVATATQAIATATQANTQAIATATASTNASIAEIKSMIEALNKSE